MQSFAKAMVLFNDAEGAKEALVPGGSPISYLSPSSISNESNQGQSVRDSIFTQQLSSERFSGNSYPSGPSSICAEGSPSVDGIAGTGSVTPLSSTKNDSPNTLGMGIGTGNPDAGLLQGSSATSALGTQPASSNSNGKTVKRKYSRNGCTECKRRRMKCDEGKPTCWQCARLNRECVYIIRTKNRKRRPKNTEAPKENTQTGARGREPNVSEVSTNPSGEPIVSNANASLHSALHSPLNTGLPAENLSSSMSELPNVIPTKNVNAYDANLLIRNLNDIVNMKLNDSMIHDDLKTMDFSDLDFPELTAIPQQNTYAAVPISFLVDSVMTFNMSLDSFKLGAAHDKYLEVFYYDCLDSVAPFFQNQGNPLRDILLSFARGESYLLSAILAVGASISHRKSNNVEDEKSYCAYLSHCLGLLTEQFKEESNVFNKIEPIILTVLMLTWDCIYTMNSQWRSHLKGVTELFKKINSGSSSKVLNVAKCWFKVIETFASISTVLGGALIDETDLDVIFDPYDYQYIDSLKFLNIMTPLNEFNLLRGHKEDFDLVIKEVFKALNVIRHSEKKYFSEQEGIFDKNLDYLLWSNPNTDTFKQQLSYFKIQKILVEIDRQSEYVFIDKSGVIPITSPSHPKNSKILDNAIDLVKLHNGEEIAISWYDISHQTQVLSFLLIVLLKLLGIPKESIAIQQVVQKITSFFGFLDSENPPQNLRTCYCNFAILIAGLNAIDENTRKVIKSYYKLNGGRFQRLTEHNLNRLEKVWYGSEKTYKLEDQDVLTW
ncbi:LAQU0S03e05798g1_1 [Lachancea quebecensis]|uniref:LAQU0S03e05798g1_1 n=1 Tax=Lachancea quebecensis TaxID=1654605 RepID=A0A0P1KNZ9_9SACH|nr:LAQU0S03e05798g1_1 [Lachancea quebecensis]